MKTDSIKASEVVPKWHLMDASGQTLGRFSSRIATILKGKDKTEYTPHALMGDFVVVVNAEKVRVSGGKEKEKTYFTHSGYPGGAKLLDLRTVRARRPEVLIERAVKGMLPKNSLGRSMLSRLKVYGGPEHPHQAQQPLALEGR